MAGCPGAAPFILGVWLIHTEGNASYVGLAFLPNGEVDNFENGPKPLGATLHYPGVVTWQQRGNTVTITQQVGEPYWTLTGMLENGAYMTGTRTYSEDPSLSFAFTATKAPSELLE
jgi:hypothetical protein